jgi:hypothetical protein
MRSGILNDRVPQFVDGLKDPRFAPMKIESIRLPTRTVEYEPALLRAMLLTHLFVKIVEILGIVEFDVGTATEVFLYFSQNQ